MFVTSVTNDGDNSNKNSDKRKNIWPICWLVNVKSILVQEDNENEYASKS